MNGKKDLLNDLRIDRDTTASTQHHGGGFSWLRWVAPLMLIIALGAWWLATRQAQPLLISVASARESSPASRQDLGVLNATGYITARRQATVSSKVTGKVIEVLIEEGMAVEEGDLLARLDDNLLKASLELSRAEVDAARSNLQEVRVQLHEAQRNYKRTQDLAARKLASEQSLDAAVAEVESLTARLQSLDKAIIVSERNVALQEEQWQDTFIRAPFSGMVIDKAAQPGEMISPVSAGGGFTRTGICTIVDMDSLEVEVDVSESYINRVSSGQSVLAVLNSYPDWRIPAEVITIIPAADRNRATVRVRIRLLERDDRVLPDMGVKVTFLEDSAPDPLTPAAPPEGLVVPASAILNRDNQNFVYVFNGEDAEKRSVQLGRQSGDRRWVVAGLRAGERVITGMNDDLASRLESGVALTTGKTNPS